MSGKILIIDDEIEILELLEEALHNEGYKTVTATNGLNGVDTLQCEEALYGKQKWYKDNKK